MGCASAARELNERRGFAASGGLVGLGDDSHDVIKFGDDFEAEYGEVGRTHEHEI